MFCHISNTWILQIYIDITMFRIGGGSCWIVFYTSEVRLIFEFFQSFDGEICSERDGDNMFSGIFICFIEQVPISHILLDGYNMSFWELTIDLISFSISEETSCRIWHIKEPINMFCKMFLRQIHEYITPISVYSSSTTMDVCIEDRILQNRRYLS